MVGAPWWAASDRSKLFEKGRTTLGCSEARITEKAAFCALSGLWSQHQLRKTFLKDSEVEPPKSLPTLDRQRSSWVKALTLLKRKMGTEKQQPVKTSPTSLPSTMTKSLFLGQ